MDEIQGYYPEKVRMKTEKIDYRLLQIFGVAKGEGIFLLEAANRPAESRICEMRKVKHLYGPR
jgi:hypothetical protein